MTAESLVEPQIGQLVTITQGQLEGIQGILIEISGTRFLIQLLGTAEGVFVLVESSSCETCCA